MSREGGVSTRNRPLQGRLGRGRRGHVSGESGAFYPIKSRRGSSTRDPTLGRWDRTLVPIQDGASRCARTTTAVVHTRSSVVAEWRAMLMQDGAGRLPAKHRRWIRTEAIAVCSLANCGDHRCRGCRSMVPRDRCLTRSTSFSVATRARLPTAHMPRYLRRRGHDDGRGGAPGRRRCRHDNSRAYKKVREIDIGVGQSAFLEGGIYRGA